MYQPGVKPRVAQHAEADSDVTDAAADDRVRRAGRPAGRRAHDRQRPDRRHRAGPAHHPRGLQRPDPSGLDPGDGQPPSHRRGPAWPSRPLLRVPEPGRAACSASTPPTGSRSGWPTSAATGWPRPASSWPTSRSRPDERVAAVRRAADAALSSAAVDPALVLAVAVGIPTPVDAEGARWAGRRTCPACPAATSGRRSAAGTAGRSCSRTTPTWPPWVSAGAGSPPGSTTWW